MNTKDGVINHGTTILRDYRKNKTWNRVSEFVGRLVAKLFMGSAIAFLVVGGFCTANAISGFNGLY